MKMSNKNFFKKTLFLKKVIFRFVQKSSQDSALTKSVKTISDLNNSKNTKEQLKVK